MEPESLLDQLGYESVRYIAVYKNRFNDDAPPLILSYPSHDIPVSDLHRILVEEHGMPEAVVNSALEQLGH